MLPLYPYIRPYRTHRLKVDDIHEIYIEESGTIDAIPALVIHDGPGSGSYPNQRRFFDPNKYRIILFDQRGCGQSTPHGKLIDNNTQALIEDIEKIRQYLQVDTWVIFGGSWGSTLGLLYAQAYPQRVLAMILYSILLANSYNREWFFQSGASRVFPDAWADFVSIIPEHEHNNIIQAFHNRLWAHNELERMAAAKAWLLWRRRCSAFHHVQEKSIHSTSTVCMAQIELHYLINKFFLEEDQIIHDMKIIKHISATLIHSRYDMVCPIDNAFQLQVVWPDAMLKIIRDSGHASTDPAMTNALIKATNQLAQNSNIS